MRHTSLFVSLLLATSLLHAQQSKTSPQVLIAHLDPLMSIPSCPIGFTAERSASMAFVPIHTGDIDTRQTLRLNLSRGNGPAISAASVTVHGTTNPGLKMLVENNINRDVARDFQLERQPGRPSLTLATVATREISAIRWVDLTFLKYADGTSWHATESSRCRAHINRLMLVK